MFPTEDEISVFANLHAENPVDSRIQKSEKYVDFIFGWSQNAFLHVPSSPTLRQQIRAFFASPVQIIPSFLSLHSEIRGRGDRRKRYDIGMLISPD